MSDENVEIVKGANAAFNARDLDAWAGFLDPEFEFVDHMGAVAEESGAGIETFRRQVQGWFETFPDFRMGTEEYIDAGERVVCVTHWQGTGAASGLPYSQHAAEVFTLRDGKVVRAELGFPTRLRPSKLPASRIRRLSRRRARRARTMDALYDADCGFCTWIVSRVLA